MMTFLSVLEVIALFLVAIAGFACSIALTKIAIQVQEGLGLIGLELNNMSWKMFRDKGKAQKKRSK